MKILLTNDDGYNAKGLNIIAEKLTQNHQVYIVAPDRERSATGQAITINKPLRVDNLDFKKDNMWGWKVDGTPTDCVKIALESLMDFKPDLVISGINKGANLGTDILYSGTVSAAFEGWIYGYPSIALSLVNNDNYDEYDNNYCSVGIIVDLINYFNELDFLQKNLLLNINIPGCKKSMLNGFQVTSLGRRKYKNIFEKRLDPRGRSYYWLAGDVVDEEDNKKTDIYAVRAGKISITPLHINLTDYELIDRLKSINLEKLLEK